MASDPSRSSLPFEPKRKRKKEKAADRTADKSATTHSKVTATSKEASSSRQSRSSAAIPEEISQRMFRRMLTFAGVPTALGIAIFFISYFLIVRDIIELPTYAVLLSTLGCFGLGVLGLSYGALSASWDEGRLGNWLGIEEFRTNFPRLMGAWKAPKQGSSQ